MLYLRIENQGEADIRSFLILGLSSSRAKDEKIGQFGSGSKHAINILLREGLSPSIYSGTNKFHFTFKPDRMGDTVYNQVYCNDKKTGWALEFGAIDWQGVGMALREFISNAIDASENISDVSIEIVDTIRAKAGTTRIFIPVNTEVNRYVADLNNNFLHFNYGERVNSEVILITKKQPSPARIYRKGVFVRTAGTDGDLLSLFDYNLIELSIDESRNSSEYDVMMRACQELTKDKEAMKIFFENCHLKDLWENEFSYYHMFGDREDWLWAWEQAHSDAVAVASSLAYNRVLNKGYKAVLLKEEWYKTAKDHGIRTDLNLLTKIEVDGFVLVDPPADCRDMFDKVWNCLEEMHLTNEKPQPRLKCFSKPMDCSGELLGSYANGTVFLNIDYRTNIQTILEEYCHYITKADDYSRDFQDFAFKVAGRVMELLI